VNFVNTRKGFRYLGGRIRRGPSQVAYIGSSNTAMKNGWRGDIQAWFNEKFPCDGGHIEINSSLGGVGSITGVFLAKEKLQNKKPDLAFIEFSCIDLSGTTPIDMVSQSVEALIRISRSANPDCDICFMYFFSPRSGEHVKGRLTRVEEIYEKIADHYGIPSINVAKFVVSLVNSGEMSLSGENGKPAIFRQDMVHPTVEGSKKISDFIKSSLLDIIEADNIGSNCFQMPEPINADNLKDWKICYIKERMLTGKYIKTEKTFGNMDKPVEYFSLSPGARLSFKVKGRLLGLYVIIGPDSGIIKCDLSGSIVIKKLFDRYCHFTRAWGYIISSKIDGAKYLDGQEVIIELLNHIPDGDKYSNPFPAKKPSEWKLDIIGLFVIGDVIE